jgi:hypothetical protein
MSLILLLLIEYLVLSIHEASLLSQLIYFCYVKDNKRNKMTLLLGYQYFRDLAIQEVIELRLSSQAMDKGRVKLQLNVCS